MLMNSRNCFGVHQSRKLDLSPWHFQHYQSIAELVLLEYGLGSARFAIVFTRWHFQASCIPEPYLRTTLETCYLSMR
jgi:hypothetical protein